MAVHFSWAELPFDLLHAIAMRLECVQDILAFADVCSSWRAVYVNLKPIWKPSMPWLILAENNDDNPLCIRTVVDLNNNKRYQMKLPETFGHHCWGCEDGWIFTLGLDMETHLFNPLTRSRLSLPSALTLTDEDYAVNSSDPERRESIRRNYIHNVHVISIHQNDKILVMVICRNLDLAIAQPGDSEWSFLRRFFNPERLYLQNLVHYGDSIVSVYEDAVLHFIKEDFFLHPGDSNIENLILTSKLEPDFDTFKPYTYLLEYFGSILAVLRRASDFDYDTDEVLSDPTVSYQTWSFEVFIYDFDGFDWCPVYDLGDVALFVGNSSAVCVNTSKDSNCKPNCIYFTDERPYGSRLVGHDSGVYNMEDKSVERVYHGVDILSDFCPPFWFIPKLA